MQFWYQNLAGSHYVMTTNSQQKVSILCKMPAFTAACSSIVSVCFSCNRVLVVKQKNRTVMQAITVPRTVTNVKGKRSQW